MVGFYLPGANLNRATKLEVESGRVFVLRSGFYGYVGSALGGLEQSVARHLNAKKRHHWHIDYLLDYARDEKVICAETKGKKECPIAGAFLKDLISILGFGCSDCKCPPHLFFSDDETTLESSAICILKQHRLCPLILPKIVNT